MELIAADKGTRGKQTVTAAMLHDWQAAPPRLQARDVARAANLFGSQTFENNISGATNGKRSGSNVERSAAFDSSIARDDDRSANAASFDPVFQSRTVQGVGVDERYPDERYAIGITILSRPYTVELVWLRLRRWARWLIVCPRCGGRKRYLVMAGEVLQCAKCAGVRARPAHCPPILEPIKALTRAEQAESKAREQDRRRRRWARAAGRQVFEGQVTIG